MNINRREIYRYLGVRKGEPDARTKESVEECIRELETVITPRSVYRTYPLQLLENEIIDATCFQVKSHSLTRNLAGCHEIVLMAATLGSEVDRLIRRYSLLEMSKGVVMQAASAAMIEAYVNEINEELKHKAEEEGTYLRPRFSPGYGDFPLSVQTVISDALKMEKTCGITLTSSLLMMPSKSVTAVIGVGREQTNCIQEGCEVCDRSQTCEFSRAREEGEKHESA